jgi:hypothetical protein
LAGLICIDSDGHFDRAFNVVAAHAAAGTLFVVDDYESMLHADKAPMTKPMVDRLCKLGYLESWGSIGGETWIGRMLKAFLPQRHFAARLLRWDEVLETGIVNGERGNLRVLRLPNHFIFLCDDEQHNGRSPLMLIEDGRLLGPAHYPAAMIRDHGGGMYSHYGERLWFSTSDNTDPRENGRKYEMMLGAQRYELVMA